MTVFLFYFLVYSFLCVHLHCSAGFLVVASVCVVGWRNRPIYIQINTRTQPHSNRSNEQNKNEWKQNEAEMFINLWNLLAFFCAAFFSTLHIIDEIFLSPFQTAFAFVIFVRSIVFSPPLCVCVFLILY